METDYDRIRRVVRQARQREREARLLATMSHDEHVAHYNRLLSRGRRYDALRDVLRDRVPDIERRPSASEGGDARHIIGECMSPHARPNTILFVLRVSRRDVHFPPRLQGGARVANVHERRPAGQVRPRRVWRVVDRVYQLVEFDGATGELRVKGTFTSKADARSALIDAAM